MKGVTYIVLMVMALAILSPISVLVISAAQRNDCEIGLLDVCHAGTPAISADGEMPCMQEASCSVLPPLFVYSSILAESVASPFAFTPVNEHPPQA
mgnify:CR=1 FL=1